jgi:hypothetical protein
VARHYWASWDGVLFLFLFRFFPGSSDICLSLESGFRMIADSNWGSWFLAGDFAGTKEAQKRHTSYTILHELRSAWEWVFIYSLVLTSLLCLFCSIFDTCTLMVKNIFFSISTSLSDGQYHMFEYSCLAQSLPIGYMHMHKISY